MGYGKAEARIKVEVNYKEKLEEGWVGYIVRKKPILVNGEWVNSNEDETLFGYCDKEGYLTHMCYSLSHTAKTWEEFSTTSKHARKYNEFYFDAGSNGRPLYIDYREMRQALYNLGLVCEDAIKYCIECGHSKLIHESGKGCSFILDETQYTEKLCQCTAFIGAHEADMELPGMWSVSDFT